MYHFSPELSATINEWVFPTSLLLAVVFPITRGACRKFSGVKPAFKEENIKHDMGGGMVLPHFLMIVFSPMFTETHIDGDAYALAGLYGIYFLCRDLVDVGRGLHSRTRHND